MNLATYARLMQLAAESEGLQSVFSKVLQMIENPHDPGAEELEQMVMDLQRSIWDARAAKKFATMSSPSPTEIPPPHAGA